MLLTRGDKTSQEIPFSEENTSPTSIALDQSHQHDSYQHSDQNRLDVKIEIAPRFQPSSLRHPHVLFSNFLTMRDQSMKTTPLDRRNSSGSSNSAGSFRRSVSGMKKLMPLRLQSPRLQPKTQFASWLKDTVAHKIPNPCPPIEFESDSEPTEENIALNKVSWMWSQGEKLLNDLHPLKYRETPIYSAPDSPNPCHAYFSGEDICYTCPSPGTICDELCIISHYEEEDSTDSQSQTSFAECGDTFYHDARTSMETSSTSVELSRLSELSIQCQGELSGLPIDHNLSYENTGAPTATDSATKGLFFHWADDCSSRSSSPDNLSDEVLSACATPLAPARATMVLVPRSPPLPDLQDDHSLPPRPSTPFRARSRRESSMTAALPTSPIISKYNDHSLRPQRQSRRSPRSVSHLNINRRLSGSTPTLIEQGQHMKRLITIISKPSTQDHPLQPDSSGIENTADIVGAICDILANFPGSMLFLDTPCIQSIRRLNVAQNGHLPRDSSSFQSPPKPPVNTRSRRRYRLRGSRTTKLFNSPSSHSSSFASITPTNSPSDILQNLNPTAANLRPLRSIFPHTDDGWRSILYAHLLAYNFILSPLTPILDQVRDSVDSYSPITAMSVSCRQKETQNSFNMSAKALRTLGLVLPPTPYLSGREAEVEEAKTKLEECMARVVGCMTTDYNSGEICEKVERGFVRALVEVVRGCEGFC